MLQHVRGSAGPERLRGAVRILPHGHNHDFDVRVDLPDLADEIDPVQGRHREILHDDIRVEATDIVEHRIAVGHDTHDVTLRRQQLFQTSRHDPVIVRD